MIKLSVLFLLATATAEAYVPTVESLFRNGSNQEVTSNTVSMTLKVAKLQAAGEKGAESFFRLFISKAPGDSMKVGQAKYSNASFAENAVEHKLHYSNFTAHTIKTDVGQVEKGIFFALMKSLTLNDGEHMVAYLKSLGVPVRMNSELINREKVGVLAEYKRYLIAVNRDRKKDEANPLKPDDAASRERIERVMGESMYVDTKQVSLTRDNADMAWMVSAGAFEAVISYDKRHVQRLKYKAEAGEFEIICHDYWLSNGTHFMPKYLVIKNFNGEMFQVDVGSFRHQSETEGDLSRRLQKWEQAVRGKESAGPRPEFLL